MSSELYALIALAARYWFVALIVVLLFRGWRMTVLDNRRAKLIREWMGQTGCVGEWIANPGSKKRVSYPIPREGVLGSGRSADVRIRHRDLKRAHAHFELREGGLLVRPLGSALLAVGGGHTGEAVFLQNGDVLTVGNLELMLVLFDAPDEADEASDEWFEVGHGPDESDGYEEDEEGEFPAASEPQSALKARRIIKAPSKRASAVASGDNIFFEPDPPKRGRAASQKTVVQNHPLFPTADTTQSGEAPRGGKRPTVRRAMTAPDDAETWFPEPPAAARKNRAAQSGTAKRVPPAGRDEFFNEETIWRDR